MSIRNELGARRSNELVDVSPGRDPEAPSLVAAEPRPALSDALVQAGLRRRSLLLRLCMRWTAGNVPDAEDLLSDAYVRALEASRRGDSVSDPLAFWATIIANLGRDRQRRKHRRAGVFCGVPEHWLEVKNLASGPDEAASVRETLWSTASALLDLTQKQREAVMLRSLGDEYADIAERLQTTPENARKLVQLSRAQLRRARTVLKAGSSGTAQPFEKPLRKPRQRELGVVAATQS